MLRKIAGWFAKIFRGSPPDYGGTLRFTSYKPLRCDHCENWSVVHVTRARHGQLESEAHYCEQCHTRHIWLPVPAGARPLIDLADGAREVPVEVERVLINEM